MAGLRLKKGDSVKVIAGSFKGKTGKIITTNQTKHTVLVEGLNIVKRHVKPSTLHPQGGIVDLHKPLDASKVALLHPTKKAATSRIGFNINQRGEKKRIFKVNNKEIDK